MGNSFRVDRVGMEIKREVNEILQKKVRDPRVQDVTITDVQMLGDLSAAKIFTPFIQPWPQITKKHKLVLKRLLGQSSVNLVKN